MGLILNLRHSVSKERIYIHTDDNYEKPQHGRGAVYDDVKNDIQRYYNNNSYIGPMINYFQIIGSRGNIGNYSVGSTEEQLKRRADRFGIGGGYKLKYIKYKTKYLELKKKNSNNSNV